MPRARTRHTCFLALVLAACGACCLSLVGSFIYWDMTRVHYIRGTARTYEELGGVPRFPEYYRHLLPRKAKNIEYVAEVARRHPLLEASFDIEEADFLEWTRNNGWTTRRQDSISFTIHRSDGSEPVVGPFDGICHGYTVLVDEQTLPDGTVLYSRETIMSDTIVAFDPQQGTGYVLYSMGR
jgi:hypothetical protein